MNTQTVATILILSINVTSSGQKNKNKPFLKPSLLVKPKLNQPSLNVPSKQDNLIMRSWTANNDLTLFLTTSMATSLSMDFIMTN